ncbi:MAG: SMP-30/gluconolactonase/LRE family protein, partial [Actinomycetota bacterium]
MTTAHQLADVRLELGEGALAVDEREFLCVDIRAGRVFRSDLDGSFESIHHGSATVGAAALADDGSLVVCDGLAVEHVGHKRSIALERSHLDLRLNDARVDPVGRLVGGTMADPPVPGAGALWSFDGGRTRLLVDDVTISNGLAWSADGDTMFYIDTPTQRIDAFDYDVTDGTIDGRRVAVEIDADHGSPDGMCIDAEGGLWVALWDGSAVHRYVDGRLDEIVEVPTPFVTCPAIVGTTLVITTASEGRDGDPLAGLVFAADVGITAPAPRPRVD